MLTDEQRQQLVQIALQARQWAYAPYSQYPVGAALLTRSQRIYDGANIENAAYPVSMCAERVAIFKAVSQGEQDFDAIAVVTRNGGFPCGSCRQVLSEFGLETIVIVADEHGQVVKEITVNDLLPGAFLPTYLQDDTQSQ